MKKALRILFSPYMHVISVNKLRVVESAQRQKKPSYMAGADHCKRLTSPIGLQELKHCSSRVREMRSNPVAPAGMPNF